MVVRDSLADSGAVRPRTVAWFARLACGLALVLLTVGLLLLWASAGGPLPEGYSSRPEQAISLVGLLGPPLLGGLIAARRPANPYGWLWSAYALGWAVVGFGNAYVAYVSANGVGALWWVGPIAWMNIFAFLPLLGLTALILLLFPEGRPPSGRWRWLAWAVGVVGLVTTVAAILLPTDEGDPIGNSLAMEGSIEEVADAVANVGVTALFFAVLLSAVSLLWRFRRARGQQRQQLKWLAYGGAFLAAYIVLDMVGLEPPGLVDALLEALTFAALYVGVGMAVLRYRLYDIDRLINRTLVYGLLTALLGLVYGALVLVLGQLFGGLGGSPPSWCGGWRDAGGGGPVRAGPPSHPGGRGPALQPPPLQRGKNHRGVQRPAARRDRPGHPDQRAARRRRQDDGANPSLVVAATASGALVAASRN
jgi:hypothetical protein